MTQPVQSQTVRNISSDLKQYLHMQQKSQGGSVSPRDYRQIAQMANRSDQIDVPHNTLTQQVQSYSPFDFPLSQPY